MLTKVGNSGHAFSVIPSSEIIETITAGEARKKFGVSLVISGSIQKDHESSRVIINLIDAKKQNLIQSEKLDYTTDKNLIIQDEIISVMVSMLGLEMEPNTRDQITLGGSNLNAANELYLIRRGIFREGVESLEDIDQALEYFQMAIEQDTLFAKAYAGVAQAYTLQYHFTLDPVWNEKSLKYSRRAVEFNEQDPYALMILAGSLVEKGEYKEAHSYYEQSRDLDSSRANIYSEMAYLYELESKYDEAEQCHKKARERDPDSHLTHYYLGAFYHAVARYDAITIFEEIIEIDSAQGRVLWNLGSIYYYLGDFAQSIKYLEEAEKYTPQSHNLYWALGRSYYWMGGIDCQ